MRYDIICLLIRDKEETIEEVAEFLLDMTTKYQSKQNNQNKLVQLFSKHYKEYGGTNKVIQDCGKLLAKENNKNLPFIWKHYHSKRTGIFSFLASVHLEGIKQDKALLSAIKTSQRLQEHRTYKERVEFSKPVNLSFAPKEWRPLIAESNGMKINRRHFEVCVMIQLREKLRTGDVYIQGADAYGDYRQELMPWAECLPLLNDFCQTAGIENTAKRMTSVLRRNLKEKSRKVDKDYPYIKELILDKDGSPKLKKRATKRNPRATILRDEIKERLPERNLLDVMCLAQHCTECDLSRYFHTSLN